MFIVLYLDISYLCFLYLNISIYLIPGVTAPLINFLGTQVGQMHTISLQTEICWLLVYLTAKDDASVVTLMSQGLVEVCVSMYEWMFIPTYTS